MTATGGDIIDQAIGWHLRQAGMTATDWHDFIAWLEADAAHAAAFDRVAADQALLRARPVPARSAPVQSAPVQLAPAQVQAPLPTPANDLYGPAAAPRRRWMWAAGGTAVAAGMVALLTPLLLPPASDPYGVQTAPGERRDVTLADGTRIEVSGGSRLRLDRRNLRLASLDAGEATFHVRHDDDDPFTLRSGDLSVRDVGTVFNVARDGTRLDVQVAEGAVLFQPDREKVKLTAGAALSAREDLGSVSLSRVAVDSVGGWRDGRVAFAGAPLGHVAQTMRRLYGIDMVLDPGLSLKPFTGMIRLTGTAERDVPHLAALVGAGWRHNGTRWTLSPAGGTLR